MNKYSSLKLDNQLCFSLYALSREIIKLYKPMLDELNLTYTQYIVMIVLWEEEKASVKHIGNSASLKEKAIDIPKKVLCNIKLPLEEAIDLKRSLDNLLENLE